MQQRRTRRVHSAAPNIRYQSARQEKQSGRLIAALILCLLLPPVGVAWAWREKMKGILPRILLTVAGMASMTLIMTFFFSRPGKVDEILPSPVVPLPFDYVAEPAAPAPGADTNLTVPAENTTETDDNAAQAPENIPEGAVPAPAVGDSVPVEGDDFMPAEGTTDEHDALGEPPTAEPTPEPIMVYCVSENATLYHAADTCDGQENRQAIPLTDALNAGLTPCEKCNPPGI